MLRLKEEAENELKRDINANGFHAFPLVIVTSKLHIGIQALVQGFGIGPLKVNTILINRLDQVHQGILGLGETFYGQNLRTAFRFGSNIVILDADEDEWSTLEEVPLHERSIDVWWRDDPTSHLMLLFAYLMTRNDSWEKAKIRVLTSEKETGEKNALENLHKTLQDVRIEAEPVILKNINEKNIIENSSNTTIVFLPIRLKRNKVVMPMNADIDNLASKLGKYHGDYCQRL